VPRKKEKNMKSVFTVLGLALLMGCANNDCPRKKKDCGNDVANKVESSLIDQKAVAQEEPPVEKVLAPSK
jgi:hypothetical protein